MCPVDRGDVPAFGRQDLCRLGDVQVSDLTVAAVDAFERGLLDHGGADGGALSAKSVLAVHAVLHQLLDDAVRRGVTASNVAASAAPPRHEAAVTPITISGLRHTHAAMALKAGVNPLVVSKRLGHSSTAITHDLYRHLIPPGTTTPSKPSKPNCSSTGRECGVMWSRHVPRIGRV